MPSSTLAPPPIRIWAPEGSSASAETTPDGAAMTDFVLPEAASQTLTVPSSLPVTIVRPSSVYRASVTHFLCPRRTTNCLPVDALHTRAVASALAVTT